MLKSGPGLGSADKRLCTRDRPRNPYTCIRGSDDTGQVRRTANGQSETRGRGSGAARRLAQSVPSLERLPVRDSLPGPLAITPQAVLSPPYAVPRPEASPGTAQPTRTVTNAAGRHPQAPQTAPSSTGRTHNGQPDSSSSRICTSTGVTRPAARAARKSRAASANSPGASATTTQGAKQNSTKTVATTQSLAPPRLAHRGGPPGPIPNRPRDARRTTKRGRTGSGSPSTSRYPSANSKPDRTRSTRPRARGAGAVSVPAITFGDARRPIHGALVDTNLRRKLIHRQRKRLGHVTMTARHTRIHDRGAPRKLRPQPSQLADQLRMIRQHHRAVVKAGPNSPKSRSCSSASSC